MLVASKLRPARGVCLLLWSRLSRTACLGIVPPAMNNNSIMLSVVCPAFNEEQVLPLFHRELAPVLEQLPSCYRVEVIYVDDGSRDRTLEVLRNLAAEDKRVRYLSFSRNFGHQMALTAGLQAARGEVVISLDSDMQRRPPH